MFVYRLSIINFIQHIFGLLYLSVKHINYTLLTFSSIISQGLRPENMRNLRQAIIKYTYHRSDVSPYN